MKSHFRLMESFLKVGVMAVGMIFFFSSVGNAQDARRVTLGFVLDDRQYALYQADVSKECPEGLQFSDADNRKAQFPAEAQKSERSFYAAANRGPNGENLWLNPQAAKDPLPFREVQGQISLGLNLDGTANGQATPNTCAHGKFVGPDGQRGVDNQVYRVLGCQTGYRNPGGVDGFISGFRRKELRDSLINRILLEVSPGDDPQSPDDVQVTIYKGLDKIALDSLGNPLPLQSQRVDENAVQYIYRMHGKIVDDVLVTDPIHIKLPESFFGFTGFDDMSGMRMRLKLTPTGAEGLMAGYSDLDQFWESYSHPSKAIGVFTKASGPSTYEALHRLADGARDPQTGMCKAISEAYTVHFTSAEIVHSNGENTKVPQQAMTDGDRN